MVALFYSDAELQLEELSWRRWLSPMQVQLVTRRLQGKSPPGLATLFGETDHEIFFSFSPFAVRFKKGICQLKSGKKMCTSTSKLLRRLSLPMKRVVRY